MMTEAQRNFIFAWLFISFILLGTNWLWAPIGFIVIALGFLLCFSLGVGAFMRAIGGS